MATLAPSDAQDLRDTLSCYFGADLAEEVSDAFLHHLIDQTPPSTVGLAAEWGWGDTEVRDEVCALAERVLGVPDPERDRTLSDSERANAYKKFAVDVRAAYTNWHHTHEAAPEFHEACDGTGCRGCDGGIVSECPD